MFDLGIADAKIELVSDRTYLVNLQPIKYTREAVAAIARKNNWPTLETPDGKLVAYTMVKI